MKWDVETGSKVTEFADHLGDVMSISINRIRATEAVRNWNAAFQIGTVVILEGFEHKTWSPAGLGEKWEPVVFLEAVEKPVPLDRLTIPGWDWTTKKTTTRPPRRA